MNKEDILLISMPYADLSRPSIALGLLNKQLENNGFKSRVIYGNLLFAQKIKSELYSIATSLMPSDMLLAEWTFYRTVFPNLERLEDEYIKNICTFFLGYRSIPDIEKYKSVVKNKLIDLVNKANDFIEEFAQDILASKPKIVGCTSTFYQHLPSLAILKKLKELDPNIITMMGGANCDGKMGEATHRCFEFVDVVVSGEADEIIAPLCDNLMKYGLDIPLIDLPSSVLLPIHREKEFEKKKLGSQKANDLDNLPLPDYTDYFETLENIEIGNLIKPGLLVESSRGCWWADTKKCTFCGLNTPGFAFRSKSPNKFIDEINNLSKTYNVDMFETTDNIIDMKYFESVLPHLQNEDNSRRFFYETKANLKKSHLEKFKETGVLWIQPGIESLSTNVLKHISKGVKASQNIQLLKWAREYGIKVSWNFLWGFPEEKDIWYKDISESLEYVEHLQPPNGFTYMRVHRYSEYFDNASKYNLELQPLSSAKYLFDLPTEDIFDLSYAFLPKDWHDIFTSEREKSFEGRPYSKVISNKIDKWKKEFSRPSPPILAVEDDGEKIDIIDTRSITKSLTYSLDKIQREIYLLCDETIIEENIANKLLQRFGRDYSLKEIEDSINILNEYNLLLKVDKRLIALGVWGDQPLLPTKEDFPGGFVKYERDN